MVDDNWRHCHVANPGSQAPQNVGSILTLKNKRILMFPSIFHLFGFVSKK
jgi:hypothetical protein